MVYMLGARQQSLTSDLPLVRQKVIPTQHRLIVADSRRIDPKRIGRVDLVVTSPPYWSIIDYGTKGQIGYGQELPAYITDLQKVWKICLTVLNPGCRMVVNIGDQYVRGNPGKGTMYHIKPLHAKIVNSILDTAGIKVRYLGSIIWHKISTTHTSGGASVMGSYGYPRKVYPCFENEYLAIFEKEGEAPKPSHEVRALAHIGREEWRDLTQGLWTIPGAKAGENPAPFPESIPERFIRMFTFPGETVLDPFVGGGTTMKAAASWGRNSVGIDIGFRTSSGHPFDKVVRQAVLSMEPRSDYVGQPSISVA